MGNNRFSFSIKAESQWEILLLEHFINQILNIFMQINYF